MPLFSRLYQWLGFRPEEARLLWSSFVGAFLVVGYMVLTRSLREALYLDAFDVKTLPYITASVVVLGFPIAAVFSHFLQRHPTHQVMKVVTLLSIAGLAVFFPIAHLSRIIIILFYLWTALSTFVLTAGFWIVVNERFHLRKAKRLYGWISAGGTLGALFLGGSILPLTKVLEIFEMMPIAIGLLVLFFLLLISLPPMKEKIQRDSSDGKIRIKEGLQQIYHSPHLLTITTIVMSATLASTLLDFQFKEFVRSTISSKSAMAAFFGSFYGYAGGFSLFIQIIVTSRMLGKFGVGWTLAVLPIILIAGSTCLLLIPALPLIVGVRGLDYSLRKSLHRASIEVLYIPIPSLLRRKTKAFIDAVLDSTAEGLGALIIFLMVTWGDLSSRYLLIVVLVSATVCLLQARRMKQEYYNTLVDRLEQKGEKYDDYDPADHGGYGQDLLDASFSSIELHKILRARGLPLKNPTPTAKPKSELPSSSPDDSLTPLLTSNDLEKIKSALHTKNQFNSCHVPHLVRLLAHEDLIVTVRQVLMKMDSSCLNQMAEILGDPHADFVVRRRIPIILSSFENPEVERILLRALVLDRFEIRYRAAIALLKRFQAGLPRLPKEEEEECIWQAIRFEVNHDRAVWEVQKILDKLDDEERDDFLEKPLEVRGELSLEHVFRMLALVADPKLVRTAFVALHQKDATLKSFALEYLEHTLPDEIQEKLWPFIGDNSEYQKEKELRPLEEVTEELMNIGKSLFIDKEMKTKIIETLENIEEKENEEKTS